MQIVIDIPEDVIECAKSSPNYYPTYHFEKIWRAIANGIPLDKIRAEIIEYEDRCHLSDDEYPACKECTNNVFGAIYGILDKYKAGGNQ